MTRLFGVQIILRNAVIRSNSSATSFIHPITGSTNNADRDTALLFRRNSLLQYMGRPIVFRHINNPEVLGSTYRWKVNYGGGVTTQYGGTPGNAPTNTRGVVALSAGNIV